MLLETNQSKEKIVSKYQPLADYLKKQTKDSIQLNFLCIEEILGFSLPDSALKYSAWWANSRTNDSHSWAHLWLSAGWEKNEVSFKNKWVIFSRFSSYEFEDENTFEGYLIDHKSQKRYRNSAISKKRKELDDFTCKVCSFKLKIGNSFVIETHHLNPISDTKEIYTTIEDLISLCPNCHRIAHMKTPPYSLDEMKELYKTIK